MDPNLILDVWIWRGLVHDVAIKLAIAEDLAQGDPSLPCGVELRRAVASVARASADLRALGDALQAQIKPTACAYCVDGGCAQCPGV